MMFFKCPRCGQMAQKLRAGQRICDGCLDAAEKVRRQRRNEKRAEKRSATVRLCAYCGKILTGQQKKYCTACSYRANADQSNKAYHEKAKRPKVVCYCRECGVQVEGRRHYCQSCEARRKDNAQKITVSHPSGLTLDELARYATDHHMSYGYLIAYYRDNGRLP